jgi:hypothetical protein
LIVGEEADIRHVILRDLRGMLEEVEKRDLEKVEVVKVNEKEGKVKRKAVKVTVESS